jgi:N-acetylneuraminate synthase
MVNFYNQLASIVSKSVTFDRIVILGKGGSLNGINKASLDSAFVININDSERYYPGAVAVFHSPWVYESIKLNGFKCSAYITNLSIPTPKCVSAPYKPYTYDSPESAMELFSADTFYLTDFLLLSALKLALIINELQKRQTDIFLLGFDFDITEPSVLTDFSGHEADFKRILLKSQRNCYEHVKQGLDSIGLGKLIKHVGSCNFSALSVEEFCSLSGVGRPSGQSSFTNESGYRQLLEKAAEGHVLIVAEFTNNHIGDGERLVQMIRLAKHSGADMVKVQKRDVETFYTKEQLDSPYVSPFGKTLRDYRNAVEIDAELMSVLKEECRKEQIVWFSSVLDYPSFQFTAAYNPPLIKLPSTISDHRNYLRRIAAEFSGDLVVSTGCTDAEFEVFALDTFLRHRNLFLLQAVSSYPAPPEACQIAVIRHYDHLRENKLPNLYPGYSSHDVGSTGCMLAVAAGARMIEKHVKLGNLSWIHYDGVAVDLQEGEFAKFVKDIRKAEVLTGSGQKVIHEQEHHKYAPNRTHN